MFGNNLKVGNLIAFNAMISHYSGKNIVANEAAFLAMEENDQVNIIIDFLENENSISIQRVSDSSDYTGGRTNKYDEYFHRLLLAFNTL